MVKNIHDSPLDCFKQFSSEFEGFTIELRHLQKIPQSGICPAPCVLRQWTSPLTPLQYKCKVLHLLSLHKNVVFSVCARMENAAKIFSEGTLTLGIGFSFVSNKFLSFYLSFHIQISNRTRSGTFQNNQRLHVFSVFCHMAKQHSKGVSTQATDE